MITFLILIFVLVCIYFALPLWAKLIIFAVNFFVPDPIPVLDEVLMVVGVINDARKLGKVVQILNWMRNHKLVTALVLFAFVATIVMLLSKLV